MCGELGAEFYVPPISLCGDNAAMIAAAGYYKFLDGKTAGTSLNASALD
jgi:N6-L-threonylcarbamoyladenine synthase